jgi:hypothetical protein
MVRPGNCLSWVPAEHVSGVHAGYFRTRVENASATLSCQNTHTASQRTQKSEAGINTSLVSLPRRFAVCRHNWDNRFADLLAEKSLPQGAGMLRRLRRRYSTNHPS